MMTPLRNLAFAFNGFIVATTVSALPPNFECLDKDGIRYRAWISNERRALEVTTKTLTREYPLSGANIGRPPRGPGERLVYQHWNPRETEITEKLDPSVEFVTQYVTRNGTTEIHLGIVIQHQEKLGLKCTASQVVAPILAETETTILSERLARELQEMSEIRVLKGALAVNALKSVESTLLRMVNSPNYKNETLKKDFIQKISLSFKKISPVSISQLKRRMTGEGKAFLSQILSEIKYDYYPAVERARTWVIEGCRPNPLRDIESVRSGFAQFVASPGFKENDMKVFFTSEVLPSLKQLDDSEMDLVKKGLSREAQNFAELLYGKAHGKRSLADFPEIESWKQELLAALQEKEFNPMRVRDIFQAFNSSSIAMQEDSRKLFIESLRPVVQKLTPRQLEDVRGWLEEPESQLFSTILSQRK